MDMFITPLFVLVSTLLMLSFPSYRKGSRTVGSVLYLGFGMVKSLFIVVVPLLSFVFLNTIDKPLSKADCRYGWIDCFEHGKYALLPLFLWSIAALWVIEIPPREKEVKLSRGVSLGLFVGIFVSGVLSFFNIFVMHTDEFVSFDGVSLFAVVLFSYLPVWYLLRFVFEFKNHAARIMHYVWTALSTLPFWFWSVYLSKSHYMRLPDVLETDSCFIVTAASCGHRSIVKSYREPQSGETVNKQLQNFRRFEAWWKSKYPVSHMYFRRVYNRIGPAVACRIRRKWLADTVYIALKPFEWAVRLKISDSGDCTRCIF